MDRVIAEEVLTIAEGSFLGLPRNSLSRLGTGTALSVRIRVVTGPVNYAFTANPTTNASFVAAQGTEFSLNQFDNLTEVSFGALTNAVTLFVAYGY